MRRDAGQGPAGSQLGDPIVLDTRELFQATLEYLGQSPATFARAHGVSVPDCHRITGEVQGIVNKIISDEPLLRAQLMRRNK